ncbi:MAG: glucose 1-dehydrogenase [Dactylosporangium sp.]|nr:glucose 1-dehydrogenase [Dactylosporangium sp.]
MAGGRVMGKVAIVTGGGSGIGRAAALALAREGAKVVIADYNEAAAHAVAQEITAADGEALGIRTDVSRAGDVEAMVRATVEQFGRVDVVFNNAAVALVGRDNRVTEIDEAVWDAVLAVNLKGTFLCCKYAIPVMTASGGGSIINNASIAALVAEPDLDAYTASKGGVLALTRSIAAGYARDGIRCNAICPGLVRTPMTASVADETLRRFEQETLLPIGEPEDIGHLVVYLASDESRYATGAIFVIDGGYTVR